jgi:Domain of unknown function (DUF1906)
MKQAFTAETQRLRRPLERVQAHEIARLGELVSLLLAVLWCGQLLGGQGEQHPDARTYLGFDANDYPGDAALPRLKQTFAFAGYWLNSPPGSAPRSGPPGSSTKRGAGSPSWLGHRAALEHQGFGFLVLFNGRLERELKSVANARTLGARDARAASSTAKQEGFAPGTVIFVDQEEGGSMSEAQMAYLLAWFDGVKAAGFRAGIYCSGMPANEGHGEFTITANYVREHAGGREIIYFVFNDACPPSPGCAYPKIRTQPAASGVPFATIWQFAQSPRRREFTRRCASTYNADGNCYAPGMGPGSPFIDVESATSPDPSRIP